MTTPENAGDTYASVGIDKVLWLKGALAGIAGLVPPILAVLKTAGPHDFSIMFWSGLGGFAAGLGAFLSTAFALSRGQAAKTLAAAKQVMGE